MKNKIKRQLEQLNRLWEIPEARTYFIAMLLQNLAGGWFFATYVLFLVSRGMSLQQANLINAIFMTLSFVLDPFTGKLADRVGQGRVYGWGQWSWALGFLVYAVGGSFWHFALAEGISAIGHALMSEALESWLRNKTDEKTAHETMSTTGSIASLAVIPTAILGGMVGARWGLEWPWVVAGLSSALAAILTRRMLTKFADVKETGETGPEALSVREVAWLTLRSSKLRYTLLIAFGVGMSVMPFNMFWAPVVKEVGGEVKWLGAMWIPIAIFISIGSIWARRQTGANSVAKAVALIGAPMVLPVFWPKLWPVVAFFSMHEIGRGAIKPILFTYSNRQIENHYRSTANSIRSACWTLGGATGLILSGFLTRLLSPIEIWAVAGATLLAVAGYALKPPNPSVQSPPSPSLTRGGGKFQ
ncbi:MAG: MFS transporter [Candidatus Shapirobacteria bacterium]|jgi:MFS family permease